MNELVKMDKPIFRDKVDYGETLRDLHCHGKIVLGFRREAIGLQREALYIE